jgi:hypothetical protein
VASVPERHPVTHNAGPTKQPRPMDCVLAEAVVRRDHLVDHRHRRSGMFGNLFDVFELVEEAFWHPIRIAHSAPSHHSLLVSYKPFNEALHYV